MDADVLEAFWRLEQEWSPKAAKSIRPDAAGPALKRLAEAVFKAATLLAIDKGAPRITPEHFNTARIVGQRWIDSTLRVIETLGATGFQRDCEAVAATVRARPAGIKLQDLYRTHRRLRKRDFDEVLAALTMQDVIQCQQAPSNGGRPATLYKAVRQRSAG